MKLTKKRARVVRQACRELLVSPNIDNKIKLIYQKKLEAINEYLKKIRSDENHEKYEKYRDRRISKLFNSVFEKVDK